MTIKSLLPLRATLGKMDKLQTTPGWIIGDPDAKRGFDKNHIIAVLREKGPLTQEEIRAAVREGKVLVKSALYVMKKKGILDYSPMTGKWRLK